MSRQDYVDLPLPCGCRLGLLILLDPRECRGEPSTCTQAEEVARLFLREWHREEVPASGAREE